MIERTELVRYVCNLCNFITTRTMKLDKEYGELKLCPACNNESLMKRFINGMGQ